MNLDGYDHKRFFENGYGIPIIWKPKISYGWKKGLFEIAVLKGTEEDWSICYDLVPVNAQERFHREFILHSEYYMYKTKVTEDIKNLALICDYICNLNFIAVSFTSTGYEIK